MFQVFHLYHPFNQCALDDILIVTRKSQKKEFGFISKNNMHPLPKVNLFTIIFDNFKDYDHCGIDGRSIKEGAAMNSDQLKIIELLELLDQSLADGQTAGYLEMQARVSEVLLPLKRKSLGQTAISGQLGMFVRDFSQIIVAHQSRLTWQQRIYFQVVKDYFNHASQSICFGLSYLPSQS